MRAFDAGGRQVYSFLKRLRRDVVIAANKKSLLSPPSKPVLDQETLELFTALIKAPETKVYLEFGAGGATLIAAQHVDLLISVESDPHYKDVVKSSLSELPHRAEIHLLHGDVGVTTGWGMPLFKVKGFSFSGKKYANAPWALVEQKRRKVDLVLIDGRFRAACICGVLMNSFSADAAILVDDFKHRREYHGVLDFADIAERRGRSVLLRRKSNFDRVACKALQDKSLHRYL